MYVCDIFSVYLNFFSLFSVEISTISAESHIMCAVCLLLWSQMLHGYSSTENGRSNRSHSGQMQRESLHSIRKTGNCSHAQGFQLFVMANLYHTECVSIGVSWCFYCILHTICMCNSINKLLPVHL